MSAVAAPERLAVREAAFSGRVALVTGSGRNIGRAIALAFAQSGADVVIHARSSRDEVEAVAEEARQLGVRALAVLADVRDPRAVDRMITDVRARLGPVDILVNSAAARPERDFIAINLDEWREVVATILDGAYLCARAVIPDMARRGRGRIINIVGLTGQAGAPRRAHVVSAKAGLIGFTKALALEFGDRGITVNAVSPGIMATEREHSSTVVEPEHHRQRFVPVGRAGLPEEVAAVCRFLASDEAAFITGQVVAVNGGAYL